MSPGFYDCPMDNDPCPSCDVTCCRCKLNPREIMHGKDASFYPVMGCFRLGNALFNTQSISDQLGRHLWKAIVSPPAGIQGRRVYLWRGESLYYLCISISAGNRLGVFTSVHSTVWCVAPLVLVWRIQRAMRAFLRRRRESRALAVCMGQHRRLGHCSPFALLDEDALRCVLVHI